MSEHIDIQFPANGAGVALYSDGCVYMADQEAWEPEHLTGRDLAVLTALVDHVSARLHAEKLQRDMGIRDIHTATPEDPR